MRYFGLILALIVTLFSYIGGGKFSTALISGASWFFGFTIITGVLVVIILSLVGTKMRKFFTTFPVFKMIMTSPQMTQIIFTVLAQRALLILGGYLAVQALERSDFMSGTVALLTIFVAYTSANPLNAISLLSGLSLKDTPNGNFYSSSHTDDTIIDVEEEPTEPKKLS
jgi:hypothetical protein